MIIHSAHNNPQSLRFTADLSPISIPTGTAPLYMRFLVKSCSYSHTHTHTICYKMAFDLHLIICTWDVVTTCIPVTVFLETTNTKEKKRKKKHSENNLFHRRRTTTECYQCNICQTTHPCRIGHLSSLQGLCPY